VLAEADRAEAVVALVPEVLERRRARHQDRGLVPPDLDVATIAAMFPLFAFHRVAVEGRPVDDDLVHRVIDGCVLPLLSAPAHRG
jgi:hypothetical protein